MEPEFLTAIAAKTGLETPQVLVSWTFDDDYETPLTSGVPWLWETLYLRRSAYRYPEAISEGTSVLTEAFSTTPTASVGDITSLTELAQYYYSLFFAYRQHSSSTLVLDRDVSRLGSNFTGLCYEQAPVLQTGTDGTTNMGSPLFTIPAPVLPALGFRGNHIEAGFIFQIADGGADDGYYRIVSVDSDTQVTLDTPLGVNAAGTVNYNVYSDHKKFWIGCNSHDGLKTLYRYDSKTCMVDFKIVLNDVLAGTEQVRDIAYANHIAGMVGVITNLRYIKLPYNDETPTTADIVLQLAFGTILTSGFNVRSAKYATGAPGSLIILDSQHLEIVVCSEATGVVASTYDISGLDEVTAATLGGVAYDPVGSGVNAYLLVANRNYIYSFDVLSAAPTSADVIEITYATAEIAYLDYIRDVLTLVKSNAVLIESSARLRTYNQETCRGYLWQQPYVGDQYTIGLYHLDDDGVPAVADASSFSNDGVLNGMVVQQSGRFGLSYQANGVSDNVDISAIIGEFDASRGSISVWFKASAASDLLAPAADRYLLRLTTDANNYIHVGIVANNLAFVYTANGTVKTVTGVHPSPDTEFHHYKLTWDAVANQVKAYFDGVQFGLTQVGLGAWAGALISAYIGTATNNTLLGYYDECRVTAGIARAVPAPVTNITLANKAHAHSGRDYAATFVDGARNRFHYKDRLFTEFSGGEYIIRNDYDPSQLHPPNKIADDGTVLFRDAVLPVLGDQGRTERLVGCLLDRIADDRDVALDLVNILKADGSYFDVLAYCLGVVGLDNTLNVDHQRHYVNHMRRINRKAGLIKAYHVLAKLLEFRITESTLYTRRWWDSVVDPERPDIYLDEMGAMDTGDENFPLAMLRFIPYRESVKSLVGQTSIPANRTFTDLTATFRETAQIGALLRIYDIDDTRDDGDYIITNVVSDTVLLVNKNWPQGSLNNLTYTLNWVVPEPDPSADFLLARFVDIAPVSMSLSYYVP
jgi:hypothetical protein